MLWFSMVYVHLQQQRTPHDLSLARLDALQIEGFSPVFHAAMPLLGLKLSAASYGESSILKEQYR